jgi:amino acid adenylation domain-containing protein/non-ribosomal peptide synthase protein (TIGR01720 family)
MITFSPGHSFLDQLSAQVSLQPNTVALQMAGSDRGRLTYAELETRANQVAHYLQGLGVSDGRFAAVLTERTPEMLIGLLGILKAGGAYLPLDPTYPVERLAFMLADSQPAVLLTQAHLVPTVGEFDGHIVCLDEEWPDIARQPGGKVTETAVNSNPRSLAYVIYTSGSTGRPKGVQISHGALANFLYAMRQKPGLKPTDVLLALTTISFDISILELFLPLTVGARIILGDSELAGDATRLAQTLERHDVTVMQATPVTWHLLLAGGWSGRPGLTMLCGGEALSRDLANRLLAGGGRLWNMYGPTETTVWSAVLEIFPGQDEVPIGPPIVNTQFYILDENLQPVPMGEPGELFIGGVGLAQGYLNRPDLTDERFLNYELRITNYDKADSFVTRPSSFVLYKTGDRVVERPDGTLTFLGRKDRQVKVHGHRIELGEIETVLRRHTAVSNCVVMVRSDSPKSPSPDPQSPTNKRLVAYLTPTPTPQPPTSNLRTYLAETLPTYMIPTHFVWLDEMPLTPNGKIDRNALPPPGPARGQLQSDYTPPRTKLEQMLVAMWQDTLAVDGIGIQDNFFELGGDSIQGAIFINQLQSRLQTYLYVAALFEAPTVGQFAVYLESHYAGALPALWGKETADSFPDPHDAPPINADDVAQFRCLITPFRAITSPPARPNPPALFILSPPRSGSTLLRVMLAGHSHLFAPPELDLLSHDSLGRRRRQLESEAAYRLEGTIRALMEIHDLDAAGAQAVMDDFEANDLPVADFYRQMQAWIAPRLLVDKSTFYALDTAVLQRAERLFENPRYIHLSRHPYGMVYSFEGVRLDRLYFSRQHTFPPRRLAELIWLVCHQNIRRFLANVPAERQFRLQYESLVRQPRQEMARLAAWLGLDLQPAMWQPYRDQSRRMTDGLHDVSASRMVGDVKFHEHSGIDPEQADRWQAKHEQDFLSPLSWEMARKLGYHGESEVRSKKWKVESDTAHFSHSTTHLPLHPSQRRLWFLAQLRPQSAVYNVARALMLEGELDVAALETAVTTIIRRHAPLRTTFVMDEQGRPQQKVLPLSDISLPVLEINHKDMKDTKKTSVFLGHSSGQAFVSSWLENEVTRPFNLTTDNPQPPLRLRLFRLAPGRHVFLVVMHHLITDGWSMGLFFRELAEIYTAVIQNHLPNLPPLPTSYGQLAQAAQKQHYPADLAYWRQQLQNLTPLPFPTDHPRPAVETFRGQTHSFTLRPALSQAVAALSRRRQVTPFNTLLAAFKLLLHRYTGQDDLLIGTPTANRHDAAAHDLIGCFINVLPLRTDLSGNPTFRQVLERVRATTLAAQAHQRLPFDVLVEALQPERDLSRQPFFQILFVWQNVPGEMGHGLTQINTDKMMLDWGGLSVTPLPVETQTAKYDLTLFLWPAGEGLAGKWEYNSDLFTAQTIKRLHGHLQTILQAIVADPDLSVAQVPLLSDRERRQLLVEWQGETAELPPNTLIHQLVERQAARTPDALAVVAYNGTVITHSLTYDQLNRRANQLARHLRQLAVGPERPVAVCLPRSVENVVALLAILKSGGAYVPIDPIYPLARIRFILEDALLPVRSEKSAARSKPRVLVTTLAMAETLADRELTIISLTPDWEALAGLPDENLPPVQQAHNLAYLIYTSGTTGQPKGVQIEHKSIINLIHHYHRAFALTGRERSTQIVSPSFDVSVWEIWTYLAAGASVHIPDEETRRSPWQLQAWVQAANISTMFVPTPMVESLLGLHWSAATSLHTLHTAGDKLHHYPPPELPFALYNHYGPTENSVYSTYCLVPPRPDADLAPPIGRPFTNIQTYILDKYMNPTPIGVPGELYLGGAGLARGYHNRPELTAERFLKDELRIANYDGADSFVIRNSSFVIYKTGDLVRYLPDGQIEFLGRLDHQVKIRGFRIELGEIEAVLGRHPAVREAVVLVHENEKAPKRLVAYLLGPAAGDAVALRHFLQERLPDYMIPAAFLFLEQWPLNASGKVDRQALLRLPLPFAETKVAFTPPRTPTEQTLAGIWQALLPVERVGVHDNFFELGGDSILSIQIVARARQAGLPLAPHHLFQQQTIAALAQMVDTEPERPMTTAVSEPATGDLPLTPIQRWFFAQDFPDPHHWNMPLLLEVTEPLDLELLAQAWRHLVEYHDMLRARFMTTPDGWRQTIVGATAATDIEILTDKAEWETAVTTAQQSLNLTEGPLLRLVCFSHKSEAAGGDTLHPSSSFFRKKETILHPSSLILIAAHHLIIDGVSWRILLSDWQTLYRQLEQGEPPHLPPPTSSYRQWGKKLLAYAQTPECRAEAATWLNLPWPDAVHLPLDFPGGVNDVASTQTISRRLTVEETAVLLRQVPATFGTQIDDVLLTALAHALRPWLGTDTILLDLEGHGRAPLFTDVDLSRTVGWFTAIYPLVLVAQGETAVADLPHIQTQLAQIPWRGIGYGILRYLADDPFAQQMAAIPQPAISFNYLGQFDQVEDGLLRLLPEMGHGPAYAAQGERPHLLQVNGLVQNGRLHLNLRFSQNMHRPATIERLADDFVAQLRQILQAIPANEDAPRLVPAQRYPLAPMQREMLAHALTAPDSPAYRVQWQARLHGPIDAHALEQAWAMLLARHAPLRSTFCWPAGREPYQLVHENVSLPWRLLDWTELSAVEQTARLADLSVSERQRPFSLDTPPLLRLTLVKLAADEYQLLWHYHHLLLDGWSLGPLWQELTAVYRAISHNQPPELPPVRPYHTYLDWLQAQDLAPAQRAWQAALADFRPFTWLPAASQPPTTFAEVATSLAAAETAALQTTARRHRLTLNTLVQGAWALTLAAQTGQDEVVFGLADAARPPQIPGIEAIIGLFVNALPIRVAIKGQNNRIAWLQALQAKQLALRPYTFCSLDQIRQWWADVDLTGQPPLFDTFLRFQNYPSPKPLPNEKRPFTISHQSWYDYWHYPLNILAIPGHHLQLKIGYDPTRLSSQTVHQMLAAFRRYLVDK